MRRTFLGAVIGVLLACGAAQASWYSYYQALQHERDAQSRIDWVEYYKRSGGGWPTVNGTHWPMPAVDAQGNPVRLQWVPYQLHPQMQWAVPNGWLQGPPLPPPATWQLPNSYPY